MADKFANIPLTSAKEMSNRRKLPPTAYFNDGRRRIDFVFAFQPDAGGKKKVEHARFRQKYESELKNHGLELEYEGKEQSQDGKTAYVKVHATWDALTRQAELEDLQMPIVKSDLESKKPSAPSRFLSMICKAGNPFRLQEEYQLENPEFFTDSFSRSRESEFLIEDQETFFKANHRIYLTWGILSGTHISLKIKKKPKKGSKNGSIQNGLLNRKKVTDNPDPDPAVMELDEPEVEKTANIIYLLSEKMYTAAFPIHDGEYLDDHEENNYQGVPVERWPIRKYLYEAWARPRQWKKYQPLNVIREYYGEKVGIYFAWLGFYTQMLIIPSIVGFLVFIGGLSSFSFKESVKIICGENEFANRTICRTCPATTCSYTVLSDHCSDAMISRVFDNGGATFFAIFMAIWAIVFLENWKRYQAELCSRWDVSDAEFSEEQVRPDYQLSVTSTRLNPVTQKSEPYLPTKTIAKRFCISVGTVLFFILVVIALLATVMVYKIVGPILWTIALTEVDEDTGETSTSFSPTLATSLTASIANGLFIAVMSKVYMAVAWKLTSAEMPRTEQQFEESYTYKVFIFQFVNFYGALFYLAFIRGKFVNPPNEQGTISTRCGPAGCLYDVSIQLFIIMTGKQAINNLQELMIPMIKNWCRGRKHQEETEENKYTRWEKDHDLDPVPPINLFGDYLEMLIQYGFITMFVPAFPLAPLFALLNNIIEVRLDAYKNITQEQRCIPVRAKDIGPWYNLLEVITKVAVVTNAAFIALTTDFIDQLVYDVFYQHSEYNDAENYMDFLLAEYNTSHWCSAGNRLGGTTCEDLMTWGNKSVETCYFPDYRSLRGEDEYIRSAAWYHVFLAKLAFILAFEHFVILVQVALQYFIPDVPDHVTVRQQRETFIQRQSFMRHEFGEDEQAEDEDFESEDEGEQNETGSQWAVESFAGTLPRDVTVNRVEDHHRIGQERPQKRPFIMVMFKKLALC